jgi:hypothetical protein
MLPTERAAFDAAPLSPAAEARFARQLVDTQKSEDFVSLAEFKRSLKRA